MRQLTNFNITVREEHFVLHLETGDGETQDIAASPDQLDKPEGEDDAKPDEIYHKPLD